MKILLFANSDWYLYNFRRSFALALQQSGYEVLLISPPGPYGSKLRELGLDWEPVTMNRRSLNPLVEVALVLRLARILRETKAFLIHSFTLKCVVYGSIAAMLARVPCRISAVAGLGYVFSNNNWKARSLRPVVRLLMRASLGGDASRVILQNSDDVSLFRENRLCDSRQIRLVRGSGVDCKRFDISTVPTQTRPQVRVLLASRLLWDKGLSEYVQAIRVLKKRYKHVQFVLAGAPDVGNLTAVPVAVIESWVDDGLIEWLGHVDDMVGLLADINIVVLPSYREGLPKSLIEAAACGKAIVTSDVPGCREVVENEIDGLLVPVKDGMAVAEAIARLIDDPGLATRLGNAARAKALAEFDENIVIKGTMAVYDELLQPDRAG